MKNKCIFSILLLILIVSLLGCNWNEKSANHYYLSFTGESKTWKLIDYEVVITPESLKAGNGTLQMKNKNKFIVESFHFETHIVFNNKDRVVHAGYITGGDIDIVDNWTGSIDGGTYINENGVPITFNEISNIYMMVEWQDTGKKESVSERIDLYNKSNKDQTFFN